MKKTASKTAGEKKSLSRDITFQLEKETPGAVRFHELDGNGDRLEKADDGAIGTLYVRKAFLKAIGVKGAPEGCKVTITFE